MSPRRRRTLHAPQADHAPVVHGEGGAPVPHTGPETWAAVAILAAMALLPAWDIVSRALNAWRVPGSQALVKNLCLVITFVGGALAARSGRLLNLSTAMLLPASWQRVAAHLVSFLTVAITASLAGAAWQVVVADREGGEMIAGALPMWAVEAVMPAGYAAIAGWTVYRAAGWAGRLAAAAGLLVPVLAALNPEWQALPGLRTPGVGLIIIAAFLGLPIFAVLGGLALLLFWTGGTPVAAVPAETYRLTGNEFLPAIPLFTFAGYLYSASGSSLRLVKVFDALLGWLPGGLAVATAAVFAFFTSFTGASGVTILSLGGLLLPVLIKSGYPPKFSLGLVTASGSIGLLFPPSLPVILFGVRTFTPIDQLFIGALIPGLVLVGLVAILGVWQAKKAGAGRKRFKLQDALSAAWMAKWELALPVLVLVGIFGGFTTLVETSALTVLYAILTEGLIYGDLKIRKDMPRVVAECTALVGGIMVILGAALGFTNWTLEERIPDQLVEIVKAHVDSKLMFLLILNVFLIVVGFLMDIYSAILVVVPLILPIATAYGVHPVHLGAIFLANLELGYLHPPLGLNLFLSASRFNKSIWEVAWAVLPFLLFMILGVLLITYVPWMSLGLLEWLRPGTIPAGG